MENAELLLSRTGFRDLIDETTVDAGFDQLVAVTRSNIQSEAFCSVVADSLSTVRLSQGVLQCRWHLELTAADIASVRLLANDQSSWLSDLHIVAPSPYGWPFP